jgi:proline dehydrogenase
MLRALLLELAKSSRLRRWITSHGATRRMARRFVPGEELAPAIEAARASNKAGMTASLDHLGENVVTREDAERARASYTEALEQIAAAGVEANVSLKLTHLGLDLGGEFCAEQLRIVARRAEELGNFVRVGCRIRLVKGAYKEPSRIAFRRKKDVDANFIKLMKILLPSGTYHALATHDPKMIEAAIRFAAEQNITKDKFEFQMLYGIRTDLQTRLVRQGYRVRVYIPFGKDWFPYFMRRLAERPANLVFFAKNFLRRAAPSA